MSSKSPTAVGMYAILGRDPEAFIDYLPEIEDSELDDLWLMLSTPNPKSDADLNSLGASLVKPHFELRKRQIPEPVSDKFAITVRVSVPVTVVVKAKNLDEADRIAIRVASDLPFLRESNRAMYLAGREKYKLDMGLAVIGYALLDPADNLVKFSTATCAGCGAQTLKEEWGPGWMHCPRCGRRRERQDPE